MNITLNYQKGSMHMPRMTILVSPSLDVLVRHLLKTAVFVIYRRVMPMHLCIHIYDYVS